MIAALRQFRRAPGRILASIFALALAVGAIGVLAIPKVALSSLHEAARTDGLADIVVDTTPLDADQIAEIASLANVAAAEGEVSLAASVDPPSDSIGSDLDIRLVGLASSRTMDLVKVSAGRLAAGPDEVVVQPSLIESGAATLGSSIRLVGQDFAHDFMVVGVGSTVGWSGADAVFASLPALQGLSSASTESGTNLLVITADDDSDDALRAIAADVQSRLVVNGDRFTDFPIFFPDGTTPIDADIVQVSQLIGLLGIFSGLVALVLLSSTTNTLITERTREVAIMRAIGGTQRAMRRRLHRIALVIATAALVVGLPFGIAVSNLIARLVLEEFVGITPDAAVDIRVLIGSVIAVLLGARLVSARAARRVTNAPLATALRDRDGAPFGATRLQRLAIWAPLGTLQDRLAVRASLRRPARTVAVVVQIAAAVGAAFLIPTLATSVNDYNTSAFANWRWNSVAVARSTGLPFSVATPGSATSTATQEMGIQVYGEIGEWELEVYGITPDSTMIDPAISSGRWLTDVSVSNGGGDGVVISSGFAARTDIVVGDRVELTLPSGVVDVAVVGLSDDSSRAVYLDREVLATQLGAPGRANVIWSTDDQPTFDAATAPGATTVSTRAEIEADSSAGTSAIVTIFGAIGVLVSGVAALAVMSSMSVNLFERRHELATMQAIGARRRTLRALLARELLPLAAIGTVGGLALGAVGARAIIASFESSNAIDIGVTDAYGAIPFVVAATAGALLLLVVMAVRSTGRRPIAVTLRGAA